MKTFIVRSPAKINLCLNVLGKREDGYHILDGIMLPLELHDSLQITELVNHPNNLITIDDFSVGNMSFNLANKSLVALANKYSFNNKFRVRIHKCIPMQAGMGGGSSNAGVTLTAINKYLKLNASEEDLIKIATPLGADIPFFINPKPCRCGGIGENLRSISVKNDYYCLIVKPQLGCSTREVFLLADQETNLTVCDVDKIEKALAEGDDETIANTISNSLENPAMSLVPEIANIKQTMKEMGLKIVLMTGSGSAVFGLSTNKKEITKIAKYFDSLDIYTVELTKIVK